MKTGGDMMDINEHMDVYAHGHIVGGLSNMYTYNSM